MRSRINNPLNIFATYVMCVSIYVIFYFTVNNTLSIIKSIYIKYLLIIMFAKYFDIPSESATTEYLHIFGVIMNRYCEANEFALEYFLHNIETTHCNVVDYNARVNKLYFEFHTVKLRQLSHSLPFPIFLITEVYECFRNV